MLVRRGPWGLRVSLMGPPFVTILEIAGPDALYERNAIVQFNH